MHHRLPVHAHPVVWCQELKLTWWPLARDSTYYTISLLTLAVFFGVITPQEIQWWVIAQIAPRDHPGITL